ncbi:hypothetical protein [Methanobacterium sp.]|jgi:hypothetical protein|uniref:hypothetical protein n=1 Tax=Methanobacterium sp. TaxID=2164 RepID=UPI002587DF68|nr:hypothetical protein [Methanobacterium sp.]
MNSKNQNKYPLETAGANMVTGVPVYNLQDSLEDEKKVCSITPVNTVPWTIYISPTVKTFLKELYPLKI